MLDCDDEDASVELTSYCVTWLHLYIHVKFAVAAIINVHPSICPHSSTDRACKYVACMRICQLCAPITWPIDDIIGPRYHTR